MTGINKKVYSVWLELNDTVDKQRLLGSTQLGPVLYCIILYYVIVYYIVLYYITLYDIILCCIILYYIICFCITLRISMFSINIYFISFASSRVLFC